MDVGVNRPWTTLWLAHSMITLDRGLGIRRGEFPEHWERMSLRCGSMDDGLSKVMIKIPGVFLESWTSEIM